MMAPGPGPRLAQYSSFNNGNVCLPDDINCAFPVLEAMVSGVKFISRRPEKQKAMHDEEHLVSLPVVDSDQYGSVELVLGAVGLWTTGVDERVNSCQNEALLVKLLQLTWQLPNRRQAQRGRPA